MVLPLVVVSKLYFSHLQLWIHVPLYSPEDQCGDFIEQGQGDGHITGKDTAGKNLKDTWTW